MSAPTPPLEQRLQDVTAERVRQSHARAIAELQALPAAALRVISGVLLPSGVNVPVAHGLGRAPLWVGVSIPRSAAGFGAVIEVTGLPSTNRAQIVVLQAGNFAATVTVDVLVL